MKIVNPEVYVDIFDTNQVMKSLERRGRVCYKSEHIITPDSAERFLKNIIERGHESVLEHEKLSVKFVVDRGVSHEIVRHRIASYSQESTRYCNYSGDKFDNEITVIRPFFFDERSAVYDFWEASCQLAETSYLLMLDAGSTPQEARSVLPNSLKTEIEVTFNFREWRHFFRLRCSSAAHPQMQQVTIPLLLYLQSLLPVLFLDIPHNHNFLRRNYAKLIGREI